MRNLGRSRQYLEVVAGRQVELLDVQHVAEDSGVLEEDRVLVGKREEGLESCRRRRHRAVSGVPEKNL